MLKTTRMGEVVAELDQDKLVCPRRYVTRFTVEGRSRFAFDMLRYDQCFPAFESDTRKLTPDWNGDLRSVTLTHYGADKDWKPTVGRWQSFGWTVVDVQGVL